MPFLWQLGKGISEIVCLGSHSAADKFCSEFCQFSKSCTKVQEAEAEAEIEAAERAEYRAGANGTNEYFKEMTTPERELEPPDPGEDFEEEP